MIQHYKPKNLNKQYEIKSSNKKYRKEYSLSCENCLFTCLDIQEKLNYNIIKVQKRGAICIPKIISYAKD